MFVPNVLLQSWFLFTVIVTLVTSIKTLIWCLLLISLNILLGCNVFILFIWFFHFFFFVSFLFMTQSINVSMTAVFVEQPLLIEHKGVYRTAPATPGLLIIISTSMWWIPKTKPALILGICFAGIELNSNLYLSCFWGDFDLDVTSTAFGLSISGNYIWIYV